MDGHVVTPNKELAAKVLRQITEHPETHDQEVWFEQNEGGRGFCNTVGEVRDVGTCGTVGCVAGWAVALHYADKKRVLDSNELLGDAGSRLLRLSWDDAEWLFYDRRTHDEVVEALQRIVDGKPVRP